MISLHNPDTGMTFDFDGKWLRSTAASLDDVRSGLAEKVGDKVYLDLPAGVHAQLAPGGPLVRVEARQPARSAEPGLPRRNASHQVWIDYAASQGMSRGEAAAMPRDELRDRFTDQPFDPDAPPVMGGGSGDAADAG